MIQPTHARTITLTISSQPEHKAMNQFLNSTTEASQAAGRVKILYEHLYQTDTFATLSPAGLAALPASVQKRPVGRELRLRTSRNTKTNEIIAHIVKVPLGDLHIQNPCDPYDCRISMNLEVNFPPDVDISELIEPHSHDRPPPPERRKDRLSYKHLAYSIDLTKVESHGVPSKYELELEVDANVLRQQIERGKRGLSSAYTDVVSGFFDNATYLMRQAP
jgi:polynucleotide 5'-triphosphatase